MYTCVVEVRFLGRVWRMGHKDIHHARQDAATWVRGGFDVRVVTW